MRKESIVALITPFANQKIDFEALDKIIDFQLQNKTDAIVVLGTTGEAATITEAERQEIIKFAKIKTKGKAKLIVGTGSNNAQTAVKYTKQAQDLGADTALVVSPYYNKCTQQGVVSYYNEIAKNSNIPLIIYNVPSRTGFNILPSTVCEIAKIKNVCGLKEANGDINHVLEIFHKTNLPIYCGNDNLNYLFLSLGAHGVISVVANILPNAIKQQCLLAHENEKALNLHKILFELSNALFVEPNPIAIKYCMSINGFCQNELRLPLTQLSKQYCNMLELTLNKTRELL